MLMLISALVFLLVYVKLNQELDQPLIIVEKELFTVTQGSSIRSFSTMLKTKQWISTGFWIRHYARLFPKKTAIKAGTYQANPGMTIRQLLTRVVTGREYQFKITFIEGTTFKEWLALLKKKKYIKQTLTPKSIAQIAAQLSIAQPNPEGWFFPDTYAYTAGTKDIVVLKRAYNKMLSQLNDLWNNRQKGLPYTSPYQALIMASIIEKETGYLAEQPLISSVFINRLRKKMRLQTDPTIIYGLGERYQGDITLAHKREKTAYNTYRVDGLPPTPIAMPSLSALKAALNPATSTYFYFVSDGYGKHVFSKSLTEHNAAVRQYLKNYQNNNG